MLTESGDYYPGEELEKPRQLTLTERLQGTFQEIQQGLYDGQHTQVLENTHYQDKVAEIAFLLADLDKDPTLTVEGPARIGRMKLCETKIRQLDRFINNLLESKYGYKKREKEQVEKRERAYQFSEDGQQMVVEGVAVSLLRTDVAELPRIIHGAHSDQISYGNKLIFELYPFNASIDPNDPQPQKIEIIFKQGRETDGKWFYEVRRAAVERSAQALAEFFRTCGLPASDYAKKKVEADDEDDDSPLIEEVVVPTNEEHAPVIRTITPDELAHREWVADQKNKSARWNGVATPFVPLAPLGRLVQRFKRPLLALGFAGGLLATPETAQQNNERPAALIAQKRGEEEVKKIESLHAEDLRAELVRKSLVETLVDQAILADKDLQRERGKKRYDRTQITAFVKEHLQSLAGQHNVVVEGKVLVDQALVSGLVQEIMTDNPRHAKRFSRKIIKPLIKAAKRASANHTS